VEHAHSVTDTGEWLGSSFVEGIEFMGTNIYIYTELACRHVSCRNSSL